MPSEYALMLAGWTVFALLGLLICCALAYWLLDHRKHAKRAKQAQDLELQKSRIRMIPQVQAQSSVAQTSLPDPFTSNGSVREVGGMVGPVSLLRKPRGRGGGEEVVEGGKDGGVEDRAVEVEKGEAGSGAQGVVYPLEAKSPEPRDSLDMESLCGSPFSIPENWGKVI